ncbi:MAG: glycoside hydrolase family 57 protein [Pseudomonadota bacterium]
MASRLNIAFLWHMHQPYYRDPLTGVYSLPWVRLHAIKSYYDMPRSAEHFPEMGMTFNLVPSLLLQLSDYAEGRGNDVLLAQSRTPAADLDLDDRRSILTNFFMCNWDTMVKPYPAYWNLLAKRGLRLDEAAVDEALARFSVQDFLDLQVWFNLGWFGFTAMAEDQGLRELRAKGRLFSEEDKHYVLDAQQRTVAEIIPTYRRLLEGGRVELSTSPFYHPILPLLIDTDIARRCMPRAQLPPRFSHPDDASAQIARGVTYFNKVFGRPPVGMWPSEGSVCPELISLAAAQGLRWLATDEAILFNSLSGSVDRRALFEPYLVGEAGAEVSMVFRDRGLSDLIGFTYGRDRAHDSAGDLHGRLRTIRDSYRDAREPLVCIILDGENPWEYYYDGGEHFLTTLFERITKDPTMEAVSIASYIERHPAGRRLAHLHSGSWINHNYEIWIGGEEENRAWTLLGQTRDFFARFVAQGEAGPESIERAREELFAAEGSDWFWWYGDQFSSDNDAEFDRLFRLHLANVYTILGAAVPEELGEPVIVQHRVRPALEPIGFIAPIIDGLQTNFYEWKESGLFQARGGQAAMYHSERYVGDLYYGFNLHNLYLRLDPATEQEDLPQGLEANIDLDVGGRHYKLRFPLVFGAGNRGCRLFRVEEGKEPEEVECTGQVCSQRIAEVVLPFKDLGASENDEMRLRLELRRGTMLCERVPRSGYVSFRVPGQDFERVMWSV